MRECCVSDQNTLKSVKTNSTRHPRGPRQTIRAPQLLDQWSYCSALSKRAARAATAHFLNTLPFVVKAAVTVAHAGPSRGERLFSDFRFSGQYQLFASEQ